MSSLRKFSGLYSKFHTIHPDFSCMTYLMDEMIRVNSTLMYRTIETEIYVRVFVSSCHQTGHVACTHIFYGINSCMESLEFIIDSCNSCFALSSIVDIQSSVPLVINRREWLVVLVGKQMNRYRWTHVYETTYINWYVQIHKNHSVQLVLFSVLAFEESFMWLFIDSQGNVVMAS